MLNNRLLAALPTNARRHFLAGCDQVELAMSEVLCEPGGRIREVYFPTRGLISLQIPMNGNGSLGVGLIGSEGMLGTPLVMGIDVSPMQALVQGAGLAWRIEAATFRKELEASPALRRILNRHMYVLMTQLAQAAACARYHLVEARLARLLLMTQDRVRCADFHLTHDLMAHMLGVRRVGVTKAAFALQKRNLISYARGNITIIDDEGMQQASCDCYQLDKNLYDRILS